MVAGFLLKRWQRTTLLMVGSVACLLGLVAARRVWLPEGAGWLLVPLVLGGVVAMRRQRLAAFVLIMLCGFGIGLWRGGVYMHELRPYRTLALRQVSFTATANIDAVYGTNGQITFTARNVMFAEPRTLCVPGTVKVAGFGLNMVYRGDRVLVTGKLYPTRGANQATVAYAQLSQIGSSPSAVDTLRRKFTAGMQSALPEPLASFGLGLLVGQRNTLPADLTQALMMVGLTHIIAVSGYNLTILLEATRRVLGERSKVLCTVSALALMLGFLLLAGTGASLVRAAVISTLSLGAWYYGRSIRPVLLVLLAAALTATANPVYIWSDISWYLSFLAFFGILVLGPAVTKRLFGERTPPLPAQLLIECVCAEVMTIPLVLYIFGQLSLVSLLANMLVAALIPLAMLLSLVAGLAGMLAGAISGWFAWPADLLLTYMLDVVRLLSGWPHIFLQNRYLSAVDMALCYTGVSALLLVSSMANRRRLRFFTLSGRKGK